MGLEPPFACVEMLPSFCLGQVSCQLSADIVSLYSFPDIHLSSNVVFHFFSRVVLSSFQSPCQVTKTTLVIIGMLLSIKSKKRSICYLLSVQYRLPFTNAISNTGQFDAHCGSLQDTLMDCSVLMSAFTKARHGVMH